jgi:calmodulin
MNIKMFFRVFDYDNNGFVSTLQLRHVLTSLGEKLNMKEIEELIRQGDRLGRGQIHYVGKLRKKLCSISNVTS